MKTNFKNIILNEDLKNRLKITFPLIKKRMKNGGKRDFSFRAQNDFGVYTLASLEKESPRTLDKT